MGNFLNRNPELPDEDYQYPMFSDFDHEIQYDMNEEEKECFLLGKDKCCKKKVKVG